MLFGKGANHLFFVFVVFSPALVHPHLEVAAVCLALGIRLWGTGRTGGAGLLLAVLLGLLLGLLPLLLLLLFLVLLALVAARVATVLVLVLLGLPFFVVGRSLSFLLVGLLFIGVQGPLRRFPPKAAHTLGSNFFAFLPTLRHEGVGKIRQWTPKVVRWTFLSMLRVLAVMRPELLPFEAVEAGSRSLWVVANTSTHR
uniref:Uncharacterized protein n=1 Tax=Ixodes ricinus TaxID=34613 RepID=A0A147BEJ2_IXORI